MGLVRRGGDRHVAAYLAELDLSDFDAKAPPPKTAAFWDIVEADNAPPKTPNWPTCSTARKSRCGHIHAITRQGVR